MIGAVPAQQACGDLVPERAAGDALCRKRDPFRHAKSVIAQNVPDKLVAQHFRSVRPKRDRPLQTGLANELMRFFGIIRVLICDGRQPGINDGGDVVPIASTVMVVSSDSIKSTIRGRGAKTIGQNA